MSGKLKRSRARSSVRGRRTPAQPQQASRGSGVPRAVIISVLGIGAVVALVAFLIWQQTRPGGDDFSGAAAIEADPAPDLQGEFVNLQEIYDGEYGNRDGNTTAPHVTRDVDYVADGNSNPPAGGPHWGSTACATTPDASPAFCGPAQWGIYRDPWPPEPLVHAMEHGGVIVWYNTEDQTIIDDLENLIEDRLNRGDQIVLTPYREMEEETIALTAWVRLDKFSTDEYTLSRVDDFIGTFDRRFNPEGF